MALVHGSLRRRQVIANQPPAFSLPKTANESNPRSHAHRTDALDKRRMRYLTCRWLAPQGWGSGAL